MIPKKIHYCWFGGGKMPRILTRCIASWRKYCPDYEIKRWDESNSPMEIQWVKNAYACKKYAFVADYVRLYALYTEGGIYMDTDMLLIDSLDTLLKDNVFLGFEDKRHVNVAIMGMVPKFPFAKTCLDYYDRTQFDQHTLVAIPKIVTPILHEYGLIHNNVTQLLNNGIKVYQNSFFYPIGSEEIFDEVKVVKGKYQQFLEPGIPTLAIHLWYGSWVDEMYFLRKKLYAKGFRLAFERIINHPFQPISYYKQIGKFFIKMVYKKI